MRTTDNIIRIVNQLQPNSSLTIDGTDKTTDNLIRIAKACADKKVYLTIRVNDRHTTDNVIRLVKAGDHYINIELI